jgi:hypothetical protein
MILCSRPECQTTAGCKCGSRAILSGAAVIPASTFKSVTMRTQPALICSFCGKSEDECRFIVGGVVAMICDGCLEVCRQEGDRMLRARGAQPLADT